MRTDGRESDKKRTAGVLEGSAAQPGVMPLNNQRDQHTGKRTFLLFLNLSEPVFICKMEARVERIKQDNL